MSEVLQRLSGFGPVLVAAIISLAMRAEHLDQEFSGYHSWRQTQTQTTILCFAFEDASILDPRLGAVRNGTTIERYEFPLMQWMWSLPYRLLGDRPFWSRLMSFVCSLGILFAFHRLLLHLGAKASTATIGGICMVFSPLFYYYSINPLPDLLALAFGMGTLAVGTSALASPQKLISGTALLAVATACKLPFIVLAPCLFPALVFSWVDDRKSAVKALMVASMIMAPVVIWYAWVIPGWEGNAVLSGGSSSTADTLEILKYVWTMMLPEMILNYANVPFFMIGAVVLWRNRLYREPRLAPVLLCIPSAMAYYFYELHPIGKAHDYYLFPLFPFLFCAVAAGAGTLLGSARWTRTVLVPLAVLPVACYIKADVRWRPTGLNAQLWDHAAPLRQILPPDALCVVGNDESQRIFLYHLRRHGWAFNSDVLNREWLEGYMAQGATHLVSVSRTVETDLHIAPLLGPLIYSDGDVKAFELNRSDLRP